MFMSYQPEYEEGRMDFDLTDRMKTILEMINEFMIKEG